MKNILTFILLLSGNLIGFSQNQQIDKFIDSLKLAREYDLTKLRNQAVSIEKRLDSLDKAFKKEAGLNQKIEILEKMQHNYKFILDSLRQDPKMILKENLVIAYLNLLGIQNDLNVASLLTNFQTFSNSVYQVNSVTNYGVYKQWKSKYEKWKISQPQISTNTLLDASIEQLSKPNTTSGILGQFSPLTSIIIQNLLGILPNFINSNKNKTFKRELQNDTEQLINTLLVLNQFNQQNNVIAYEWQGINVELNLISKEYEKALKEQSSFYGFDFARLIEDYFTSTDVNIKNIALNKIRAKILYTLNSKASDPTISFQDYQKFLFQTQSLRSRYGNLMLRMQKGLSAYGTMLELFSNETLYDLEITQKSNEAKKNLPNLISIYGETFTPYKYIQDSAIMFQTSTMKMY